jgi:hypothetical protein
VSLWLKVSRVGVDYHARVFGSQGEIVRTVAPLSVIPAPAYFMLGQAPAGIQASVQHFIIDSWLSSMLFFFLPEEVCRPCNTGRQIPMETIFDTDQI